MHWLMFIQFVHWHIDYNLFMIIATCFIDDQLHAILPFFHAASVRWLNLESFDCIQLNHLQVASM